MWAPGALHDRLARRIAPGHHARAEEFAAERRPLLQVGRDTDRVPTAVIARLCRHIMLIGQAGLGTHDTHGRLHWFLVLSGTNIMKLWYRWVPSQGPVKENAAKMTGIKSAAPLG